MTVICYGDVEKYKNRQDAIAYYMEGMLSTEGAESQRYQNVVGMLLDGSDVAWDGGQIPEGWENVLKGFH